MGTSGNPAKKATAAKKTAVKKSPAKRAATPQQTSSVADFKKFSKGRPLPLPSGLVVRAKRVELGAFVQHGAVPNSLMAIVSEALEKGQQADIPAMTGMDEGKVDMDMVRDMFGMVNDVCCACLVEPPCHPTPTAEDLRVWNEENPDQEQINDPEELKDDELLYVDELSDEDKMFLFQWTTGGVEDLETFRREARADLDALAQGEGGKQPAKRAAGTRKR